MSFTVAIFQLYSPEKKKHQKLQNRVRKGQKWTFWSGMYMVSAILWKMFYQKLLDTVRTGQNLPSWKGYMVLAIFHWFSVILFSNQNLSDFCASFCCKSIPSYEIAFCVICKYDSRSLFILLTYYDNMHIYV